MPTKHAVIEYEFERLGHRRRPNTGNGTGNEDPHELRFCMIVGDLSSKGRWPGSRLMTPTQP